METDKLETAVTRSGAERFPVEGIALIGTLILSILGIGITDSSPLKSYRYWGAMTIVLAVAGMVIGWSRAKRFNQPLRVTFETQIVHWCATGVTIAGVFLLLKAGRLNYESTGLVLLIILGLATFLDGYRISWRFSLIGVLMFVVGIVAAYTEEYLWVLLILVTGIAIVIIIWEKFQKIWSSHKHADPGQ